MSNKVEDELTRIKLEEVDEKYMKLQSNASQTLCFETIRRINAFLIAIAIIALVLIVIAWPTWKNAVIWGSPVVYLFVFQIPLTALNEIYVAEVLVIFSATYFGMVLAYIVIDFYDFMRVFSIMFDTGNIGAVCSKPYCQGWQAYVFFAYYIVLIINLMLVMAVTMMFIRIFYLDTKIRKEMQSKALNSSQMSYIKSAIYKVTGSNNNNNNNNNNKTE